MTFSEKLRELMEDRRVTAAALARATGMSHVAVGNYLGGRIPRYAHAHSLAAYFGISTDELLQSAKPQEPTGHDNTLREAPTIYGGIDWRSRALHAEEKYNQLLQALRHLPASFPTALP